MISEVLARMFPLQITKRFYFWTILLTLIPTLILAVVIPMTITKLVRTEKEKHLYAVVDRLAFRLNGSYRDILKQKGALDQSPEQQIQILNKELQPIVNSLAHSFGDIGMGYYSIKLDSVLAINPEIKPFKIMKISHNIPYFNIYKTKKPEFGELNTSIGWNGKPITWYAYPLIHRGEVVGHVWANVKTETIYSKVFKVCLVIFLSWAGLIVALLFVGLWVSNKIKKDLLEFVDSVIKGSKLNSKVLPELDPLKEKLVEHRKEEMLLKERFVAAFNASPSGLAIFTRERKYVDVNKSFETITGYSSEEVLGRTSIELGLWDESEEAARFKESLAKMGSYRNGEVKIKIKNGQIRILKFSFEKIDFGGEQYILSVFDDVTDQKRVEKEMARLDCLNVVGQMASGIGHEVRNPMTSVRGFLQLLANKETDSKKVEYYQIMIDELDRANSIITEFLSLARDRIVKFQPVSLNTIINSLYPLLSTDASLQDKSIVLNKGDIPTLPLNEKEIRQLIINLVINAIEASPLRGVITISTYVAEGEVVLSVEDKGTGIPPEIYEKLGTPFVTSKDCGTGLGVSVCYSIALRHNAKIDVNTGPTGTTFSVRFKL